MTTPNQPARPSRTRNADGVDAVERALTILDCFRADRSALTLAQLATATGFYKSTILRLAASLIRFDYLIRDDGGVFRLGPAAGRLGAVYGPSDDLARAIRPVLASLVDATGETASFLVRDGDARLCRFRRNSPQAARHHLDEGARLPINAGASGHVLTAFAGATGKRAAAVRADGHCVSLGERDPQVAAVAVPVFGAGDVRLGALSISGLIGRFDARARARALRELKAAAAELKVMLVRH